VESPLVGLRFKLRRAAPRLGEAERARAALQAVDGGIAMPPVALSGLPADLGNLRVDDGAGPAYLEALAARLAERGAHIEVEEPEYLSPALLLERFHEWGRELISVVRSDASLLSRMEIGRWAETSAARRALDRASRALSVRGRLRAARDGWWARVASAEFWRGARSAATEDEWRWLTSSYTVLLYHRLAGELTPGQERVDVAPAKFDAQMALLRRLRFRPLEPGQLDGLTSPGASIGHRSMLVTVDDAFRDVVRPLLRHADLRPELLSRRPRSAARPTGSTACALRAGRSSERSRGRACASAGTAAGIST
jgi:hypothetical protein